MKHKNKIPSRGRKRGAVNDVPGQPKSSHAKASRAEAGTRIAGRMSPGNYPKGSTTR